ncbi:DEK_C domain-containing protein [Hirschfeldia incana]|nr:DEK_C domain-containing protein [Hirschfeldia incana]
MEEEAREVVVIDKDLKKKIKDTVNKILKRSSLYQITEVKAREEASDELDLDLSKDPYKLIVREVVERFVEKAVMAIESEMVKHHAQVVQDVEGGGSEKSAKKKKKKKNKTKKEEDSTAA